MSDDDIARINKRSMNAASEKSGPCGDCCGMPEIDWNRLSESYRALSRENEALKAAYAAPLSDEDRDWIDLRAYHLFWDWRRVVKGQAVCAQDGLDYWVATATHERLIARAALSHPTTEQKDTTNEA